MAKSAARLFGSSRKQLGFNGSLRAISIQSFRNNIAKPKAVKSAHEKMRTHFIEIFWVSLSPKKTASPSATNMPKVVPIVTATGAANRAPKARVASWVLSPISAMKKVTTVVQKAPFCELSWRPSSLSGIRIHKAKIKNMRAPNLQFQLVLSL